MQPGRRLAEGRTAEVYSWEDGRVLKLFRPGFENLARLEAETARRVQAVVASGPGPELPVPYLGETVAIGGRQGLVYARVDGPNLWEWIRRRPWRIPAAARLSADLHARMHALAAPGLSGLHGRLRDKIETAPALTGELRRNILAKLQALAEGNRLCHGDFHPLNLIVAANGPVVIDWVDATAGAPLADVARTWVILSALPRSTGSLQNRLQSASAQAFLSVYIRRYFELRPSGRAELARWIPVVAAARLKEGIPGTQPRLLKIAASVDW